MHFCSLFQLFFKTSQKALAALLAPKLRLSQQGAESKSPCIFSRLFSLSLSSQHLSQTSRFNDMYKKIRKYWWVAEYFIKKHLIFISIGFLTSLIIWPSFLVLAKNVTPSKILKIGLVGNYTQETIPIEITELVSRGLTRQNAKGQYEGDLAEKITIKNQGKIYEVKLKNNLFWPTGKKFTTADINYNFKDVKFYAKNEREGLFILKNSYAPFLNLLSIPITDRNLHGLGDYYVERIEWDGEFIKSIYLSGNKKIIYRFYPNDKIAYTAFLLGEINNLKNLSNISNFKIWKNVKIEKKPDSHHFAGIFFSFKSNFIGTEKSFRQALAYTIDKSIFSEKKAYSSYDFNSPYYSENVKKYFFDSEAGTGLFSKVVTENAKKVSFTLYSMPEYEKYAKKIVDNWNKILGTNIKVRSSIGIPYQWQTYLAVSEIPSDPDQYALWHSNKTLRFSNYRNLKIDKLLEDGRSAVDSDKRKQIYEELQKTLTEDLPAIFLFYPNSYSLSY